MEKNLALIHEQNGAKSGCSMGLPTFITRFFSLKSFLSPLDLILLHLNLISSVWDWLGLYGKKDLHSLPSFLPFLPHSLIYKVFNWSSFHVVGIVTIIVFFRLWRNKNKADTQQQQVEVNWSTECIDCFCVFLPSQLVVAVLMLRWF